MADVFVIPPWHEGDHCSAMACCSLLGDGSMATTQNKQCALLLVRITKDSKSECPKPEKTSWMDETVKGLEPKGCDPAILEAVDHFERIVAESEFIEN